MEEYSQFWEQVVDPLKCTCSSRKGYSVTGPVFSYKLRHIVGFWLVEMAISTNQKPTIYRNLYENTGPEGHVEYWNIAHKVVEKGGGV